MTLAGRRRILQDFEGRWTPVEVGRWIGPLWSLSKKVEENMNEAPNIQAIA